MLASFLAGIAIGAAIAARLASVRERAALGFALAQLGDRGAVARRVRAREPDPGVRRRGSAARLPGDLGPRRRLRGHAVPAGALHRRDVPVRGARARARERRRRAPRARASTRGTRSARSPARCARASSCFRCWASQGALIVGVAINLCSPRSRRSSSSRAGGSSPRLAAAGGSRSRSTPPATPWGILRATSMGVGAPAWGPVTYLGVGRSSTVLVTDQRRGWTLRTNGLPESGMPREQRFDAGTR